jgi:hypothetical protein
MMDFEAPSPYGDQALGVMSFINTFTEVMQANGIQVSNCIGSLGSGNVAVIENATLNRIVPMNLYNGFNTDWLAEVQLWKDSGMMSKLGVGFCPTCYVGGEPPDTITQKFVIANLAGAQEVDLFAYGAGAGKDWAPYWAGMKTFMNSS